MVLLPSLLIFTPFLLRWKRSNTFHYFLQYSQIDHQIHLLILTSSRCEKLHGFHWAHCRTSVFSCIVTMVSNLSIVYSVRRPFKESYSSNTAFICFLIGFWFFRCQRQHFFLLEIDYIYYMFFQYTVFSKVQRMLILYVVKFPDCWQ